MRLHRPLLTLPLAFVLVAGGLRVSTAPLRQAAAPAALSDGIALSKPESVGFSSEALKDLSTPGCRASSTASISPAS